MALRHRKADLETLELARDLVRHQARGGIVELMTGVSKQVVQEIYERTHGARPPGGPLPNRIGGWLQRKTAYRVPAQHFINCLYREMGEDMYNNLDMRKLVKAYEAYLATNTNENVIGISHCWCLARDIQHQIEIRVRPCGCCGSLYPWTITPRNEVCWSCDEIKERTGLKLTVARNPATRSRPQAAATATA
jgi:hypothetical protein